MIPFPVAPLKGVTVLVTRPAQQAGSLCARIETLGGETILFPAIAIEPIAVPSVAEAQAEAMVEIYDWLVFVSVNAVLNGLSQLRVGEKTRVAAIGKATAAALAAANIRVDACPEAGSTSEALLTHPELTDMAGRSVLIVKGTGGRELLQAGLLERGARVATMDVYRRTLPIVDVVDAQRIEQCWRDPGIDIVTLTSVELLDNLFNLLTEAGRERLRTTAFVTVSDRIAAAARDRGLFGWCVLARSADDEAITGAIAAWHARAR